MVSQPCQDIKTRPSELICRIESSERHATSYQRWPLCESSASVVTPGVHGAFEGMACSLLLLPTAPPPTHPPTVTAGAPNVRHKETIDTAQSLKPRLSPLVTVGNRDVTSRTKKLGSQTALTTFHACFQTFQKDARKQHQHTRGDGLLARLAARADKTEQIRTMWVG